MAKKQQLFTFYIDEMLLGIEVKRVQEITRHQAITRVPLAPIEIAGLINLRGQIVPALDLRRCLGVSALRAEAPSINIVLRTQEGAVSFLADEIGDVLDVDGDASEDPPVNLRSIRRELIRSIYKLERGLLLTLDVEAAISAATAPLTDSRHPPQSAT